MRVLVLGNPLLRDDSLPLRLLPSLRKKFPRIDFDEIDPADIDTEHGQLVMIDSAQGIKDVTVLKDARKIQADKALSLHGLGLAEMLTLMQAAGRAIDLKIICVPQEMPEQLALDRITKKLRAIVLSENVKRRTCKDHKRG